MKAEQVASKVHGLLGDCLSQLWNDPCSIPPDNDGWLNSLTPNLPLACPRLKEGNSWEIRMEENELNSWLRLLKTKSLSTDGASKGNPGLVRGAKFLSLWEDSWKPLSLGV